MSNSIVKPKPDTSINIRWTILSAPLGVNRATVLFEDPVGTQEYWMDFSDPADSGVYRFKYCVTSKSSGCESCDSTIIEITSNLTSVADLRIEKNLKIWPNPIEGGVLTIGKTSSSGKFYLFTAEGKLVNTGNIIQGNPTSINADVLLPGIYHIMVDLASSPRISIKLVRF